MKTFFLLSVVALLPVILSTLIYLAERTKAISKIPYAVRQIIIGILFGGLAILGTEFGVKTDGAIINARDASPICAGLLFGAPAGIIAGVIGGVERWFAVLWGGRRIYTSRMQHFNSACGRFRGCPAEIHV